MKRALILGAGQDASYLADLLLAKGYEVHLFYRRSSADNLWRIRHLLDQQAAGHKKLGYGFGGTLTLHRGDLLDPYSVENAVERSRPHEVYNLADQDHVGASFDAQHYSAMVTAAAVGQLIALLADSRYDGVRIFQPISATIFGTAPAPQSESAPLDPRSPYACAKVHAWHLARLARARGQWVACGIMYNHDSERRQGDYLLQHLARQAMELRTGKRNAMTVGDPDARVDVGYAPEYMEAAWRMLQGETPDDYIVATGEPHSVRLLAVCAALEATGATAPVEVDPGFHRADGRVELCGNVAKIRERLGWKAQTTGPGVVARIVRHLKGKA